MADKYTKWVACFGTATSIKNQTSTTYTKNLTLRYPVRVCFSGCAIRVRFSNLTGTEPVTLMANIAKATSNREIDPGTIRKLTASGNEQIVIQPGTEIETDAVDIDVTAGEKLSVSIYLEDYTQMNAAVYVTGPLSRGYYSYGNYMDSKTLPVEATRKSNWYYFLNTIDILTEEKNHAVICYGDSITAQSWPDYLAMRAWNNGYRDVSIIRRAVSGTRILRQYDCIKYAAYGLKGETRFPIEMNTAGADTVIIQHGINDIIHPVGIEENIYRPWSDLPTAEDLINGVKDLYISHARELGMKVYLGTLLPIYGWRTYAQFREDMRNAFNDWIRNTEDADGCIDFDAAVRDFDMPEKFRDGFDSGDYLHPSEKAYEAMANAVPEAILK